MAIQLKNNVSSTLAVSITDSDVGMTVAAGTGALFPTLGGSDFFYATLVSTGGAAEIVKVTARASDAMTIVRAQEGTTAVAFAAGSLVELRVTAQSVSDAASAAVAAAGVMTAAVYDPTAVGDDVFDMANMAEAADAKVLTAAERTNIATAAAGVSNWNTAFGWGNHASAGYLTDLTGDALGTLSDVTLTSIGAGELLKWNGSAWVNNTLAEAGILATSGGTLTGFLDVADNELRQPKIKDYSEVVNNIGDFGGGAQDIDISEGNVVLATVSTATVTFTFSNAPVSGTAGSFTLILTNGGSQTVNWPASVDWGGGAAPTLTASGVDVLTFLTVDGGTIWYGFPAGVDMS